MLSHQRVKSVSLRLRTVVERWHYCDEDEDEWEEQMLFDGFYAGSSTFLVSTMERYLTTVVDKCEIEPVAQRASIRCCMPFLSKEGS